MKFGSLFTGIGGFDLGFERAGMSCAWQVERDKDCNRVLTARYPNVKRYVDVKTVNPAELEPVDLVCFGWPCQDLSVAGLRAGISGERSGLFHEAIRIVAQLRPKWFVAENVPGLHSSFTPVDAAPSNVEAGARWEVEEDSDFSLVLSALDELGYCISGRVVDAQYLNVAQRRERVFLVGSLGTTSSLEILFESESVSRDSPPSREARKGVAATIRGGTNGGSTHGKPNGSDEREMIVCGAVSSKWAKGTGGPAGDEAYNLVTHALSSEGADASEDGTGRGTPLTVTAFDHCMQGSDRTFIHRKDGIAQMTASRPDAGEISPTLRAQNFRDSHMNCDGQVAIVFDTTQITSPGNYSEPEVGDPCHPLAKGAHPPAVAFEPRYYIRDNKTGGAPDETAGLTNVHKAGDSAPLVAFGIYDETTIKISEELGPTLRARQTGGGNMQTVGGNFGVRRLTPRECERLQSFPDDFTRWDAEGKEISDSARYRMLGNAVCVNVAYWIAKRIVSTESK